MRKALRGASARDAGQAPSQPALRVMPIPPPIGGWNRRDTIPLMGPTDAITLDNWIPDTTEVRLRPGFSIHATIAATATAVETLIQYAPSNTASTQLFAATPTAIYDVTTATTASSTATMISGQTNGRWQHATMTNTAGTFLVLVNGADQPRQYSGTTFTTCSVSASGLTRTNLVSVTQHMNRLWFAEENQLHVWYLGISAIEGTLTKFLPPFRKGGKLMAMAGWTRDGGSGPDDNFVFVSSRGECIVYTGTDPSSSSTSALIGIFEIPDVIGRRCLIQAGAELGVLTSQGLIPLSQMLGMSPGAAARTSFTDKISGQFREQFFTTGALFGWQPVEYPRGNLLIINAPIVERSSQHQYVMNIVTGSWCRFTGIDAGCWSLKGNDIYFGGNSNVIYKFDSGTTDVTAAGATTNVIARLQTAYNDFQTPQTKRFTQARGKFLAPGGYTPPITLLVDYDVSLPSISIVAASTSGTQWDSSQWDTFQWAGGAVPSLNWQAVAGIGLAGSIAFGVSSSEKLTYNGVDLAFEPGSVL